MGVVVLRGRFGLKVLLVERQSKGEKSRLEELRALTETAGYTVVDVLRQERPPDSRYQIGRGKALELSNLVREKGVDKVIFDNDLRPAQVFNLKKLVIVEVIDRFQLILEIFARRAGTQEAKLQIELAKLCYELPFLREQIRLATLSELPGLRGGGEIELTVKERAVKRRIKRIECRLDKIKSQKKGQRLKRLDSGFLTVAITGYTNAGKSTLFNRLAEEDVAVDDGLFTTLSTTRRSAKFDGFKALLSDTVGFIDKLPHLLIDAFHSTLEEIAASDVVVLVADASDSMEEIARKVTTSLGVLSEIGASGLPLVGVFNKVDRIGYAEAEKRIEHLSHLGIKWVLISALQGYNLDALRTRIGEALPTPVSLEAFLPHTELTPAILSWIYVHSDVTMAERGAEGVNLKARVPRSVVPVARKKLEAVRGSFTFVAA